MHLPGLTPGSGHLASAGITLRISADTDNYDVFTSAGSPTDSVRVTVFVESGVEIGSTSPSTPSMDFDGFAAGSKLKLVNDGAIRGDGGNGGSGGQPGGSGGTGGVAVKVDQAITIDNTNGDVFGGGGGGGGGRDNLNDCFASGGGGGGGQGDQGGSGGGGGNSGSAGSPAGPGNGGGSTTCNYTCGESTCQRSSGAGGNGGAWGTAGTAGGPGHFPGGSGGAAGASVDADGNTITWLGGNNGTQVKGPQT